jgi:GAF domain-containing protein
MTWADTERGRGPAGTGAVLPLRDESQHTFGILAIYSTRPHAFTADEMRLLEDLAGNLAFGITGLRTRVAHKLLVPQ